MSYNSSVSRSHNSPAPLISTHSTSSSSASSTQQNQGQSEEQLGTYPAPSPPYISPYPPVNPAYQLLPGQQSQSSFRTNRSTYLDPSTASMSAYSSASDQESVYSSPGPQDYQVVTASMTANPRNLSSTDKERLLRALRTHSINTLPELRRIEKIFAALKSPDTAKPMSDAWSHYVNSHNLLNELRGVTKNYPFSSQCLDEAKSKVSTSPTKKDQNYCWLVLARIRSQGMIERHAKLLAGKPAMWGGRTPTASGVEQLAAACANEWTRALNTLLRHWDSNGR